MDALLEAKPYLVATEEPRHDRTRQRRDQGARGGGGKQLTSTDGMSPD
jgi:hypothetical protein